MAEGTSVAKGTWHERKFVGMSCQSTFLASSPCYSASTTRTAMFSLRDSHPPGRRCTVAMATVQCSMWFLRQPCFLARCKQRPPQMLDSVQVNRKYLHALCSEHPKRQIVYTPSCCCSLVTQLPKQLFYDDLPRSSDL